MAVYTNMAWPDDPYGTGQLWRKEPPLLASFATRCVDDDKRTVPLPVSYAVVYLRLHRSKPVDVTGGLAFGFRAVSATREHDLAELVRLYDLDAMRARRLAKIVTGHRLADDLFAVDAMTENNSIGRGIRSLADAWHNSGRSQTAGMARIFDTADECTERGELADAAVASKLAEPIKWAFRTQQTINRFFDAACGLSTWPVAEQVHALEWLAVCSIERALINALIAARHLDRYTWEGTFGIGAALASNIWDCFTSQEFISQE